MTTLTVECVRRIAAGRLAVQVDPPDGLDLQFIYRAALSIYWNAAHSQLEDQFEAESSITASFQRIAGALKSEYGLTVRRGPRMRWDGLSGAEQSVIEGLLGT